MLAERGGWILEIPVIIYLMRRNLLNQLKKNLQLSHINVITHSTLGVEEIQGTFLKKLLSSNAEYSRYCFHVV